MKKTCPCCGYKTLDENLLFDICEICHWEDDPIQSFDPDFKGGANGSLSLREAQKNFLLYGFSNEKSKELVRKPNFTDEKDELFVPLD